MKRSLLAGVFLASLALAKTFTLEQVLSAPFPSELIAAPGGGKVAWLLNERGARNVWMAAAPDYKGVRLTYYTAGRRAGCRPTALDARTATPWSTCAAATWNFWGGPTPTRRPTRPASSRPSGLRLRAKRRARSATGHSPAVSPKGDRRGVPAGGQIYVAPLAGARQACAADPCARGRHRAARSGWSPDGSKLAFVSDRGEPQLHRGLRFRGEVADLPGPHGGPRYQPGVVARRQAGRLHAHDQRRRAAGAADRRAGDPWSIRVASVADGTGRQIWKADRGPGQRVSRDGGGETNCSGAAGDRIVFPWETDGWTHLYSVAVEGGAADAADARRLRSGARLASPRTARRWFTRRTRTISTGGTSGACARGGRSAARRDHAATGSNGRRCW